MAESTGVGTGGGESLLFLTDEQVRKGIEAMFIDECTQTFNDLRSNACPRRHLLTS